MCKSLRRLGEKFGCISPRKLCNLMRTATTSVMESNRSDLEHQELI